MDQRGTAGRPGRRRPRIRLRQIAAAFDFEAEKIITFNGSAWVGPDTALDEDSEVNVPDPEFAPVLAARFAAEALVAEGLSPETRSGILQRLVPIVMSNPTALDTVLARLVLSMCHRPAELPPLVRELALPTPAEDAGPAETIVA